MCYVIAACGRNGHELRSHPAAVRRMPDAHANELVAHELGHAYLIARAAGHEGLYARSVRTE